MKRHIWIVFGFAVFACDDVHREAVTFRCQAAEVKNANLGREVLFHYNDGFLFLQNDTGGADNVCDQIGTTACEVNMSNAALRFRQTVENPNCRWRNEVRTSLDIDRVSGTFKFIQDACDPSGDIVITGPCTFWTPD